MLAWKDRLCQAVLDDDVAQVRKLIWRENLCNAFRDILRVFFRRRKTRDSLLHLAAYSNSTGVVRLLADRGQDVNARNAIQETPLHIAAQYDSWEVADLLISFGAEIDCLSESDLTPLGVAEACGNHRIVELLQIVSEKAKGIDGMNEYPIIVTEFDAKRLRNLIDNPNTQPYLVSEYLERLQEELTHARIVASDDIPSDVVTMNSRIHLVDMDTGEEEDWVLAFPSEADIDQGRISVLAPVGTAVLGFRTGDTITWKVPGGERHLRIAGVLYQPEASGDYHL